MGLGGLDWTRTLRKGGKIFVYVCHNDNSTVSLLSPSWSSSGLVSTVLSLLLADQAIKRRSMSSDGTTTGNLDVQTRPRRWIGP